jgi:hypothetical protein
MLPKTSAMRSVPDSPNGLQIMWSGPGACLRMGFNITVAGSPMPDVIRWSGADEAYATAKDATAAVRRFLAALATTCTAEG